MANKKYPNNPNGSIEDIAGITNAKGNVLAMMPHPERALHLLQQPDWLNKTISSKIFKKKNVPYGDGYKIFLNSYKYFK